MSDANMEDLDLPIAIRRSRRSTPAVSVKTEETTEATTIPKTPARRKRTVRFSDPGPSSGLTPMMRRTVFATPSRRRSGTPLRNSSPVAAPASTSSGPSRRSEANPFLAPLRQTMDGRVERQARRSSFRAMLNKMELQKKKLLRFSRTEIEKLKSQVKSKDAEIYELQNATIVIDTERVWDLERQVEQLQYELDRRAPTELNEDRTYDWTLAARDPFTQDDDYFDMDLDGEHFGDATQAQLQVSTPSRARSSFPTPPATSPMIPGTPSSHFCRQPQTPKSHAAVQACFPDPEREVLEEQVCSLQLEVSKLTSTLESYKGFQSRLKDRLAAAVPEAMDVAVSDANLESIEKQILRLLEDMTDRSAALEQLSARISDIGFTGKDAEEMLASIVSGFRAARLELEYLTPGEITLPLTSHGAEVLDLLLTNLRDLARRVKEGEDSIDEYHSIEQSLRKQLDGRVTAMDQLKAEMSKGETIICAADVRIHELEVANQRLKGAIDTYDRDMKELERLVQKTDQEKTQAVEDHDADKERDVEALEAKDRTIAELEDKIKEAVRQAEQLLRDMSDEQDRHTRHVVKLNQAHGRGLALRDARVMELRVEIDRVNESLRESHETIRALRVQNGGLLAEQDKAKKAMDAMQEELQRVLRMSQAFLRSAPKRKRGNEGEERGEAEGDGEGAAPVVRPGRLLSGELARRASRTKRPRDSGLGFLDEDECEMF
ncbi:hypothetical protein ISF_07012 [Cordyceps fumosorosea ARSEF 2679]|uniref:Uncharacterized protein n=1 Tax=Cordyceps fumosorosea (strain ARSEF 2679) TaxID=1081104 RepID=A0A167QMD1_CORFA|nr:hypothetical protein ISF_07012 [Cordyceps fumosorosea ARSEF 2679]OAA57771.1 hypothetical protein ISF_07012 [Cordyceps fumosorosea ARSEF 2679]